MQWINEAAKVSGGWWGWEVSGTVKECMRVLLMHLGDPNLKCLAGAGHMGHDEFEGSVEDTIDFLRKYPMDSETIVSIEQQDIVAKEGPARRAANIAAVQANRRKHGLK